jgi:hypothetical protein
MTGRDPSDRAPASYATGPDPGRSRVERLTHPEKASLRLGDAGNSLEFDQDLLRRDHAAVTRPIEVIILASEAS